MSDRPIPFVDLALQHRQIAAEVQAGFARVLETSAFVFGEDVAAFEDEFARFSEAKHCVGVASGTDALELALRALGVGRGDEVVLPANTVVATALAVVRAGATPVLVDADPRTLLVDPARVADAITPRTKALLPVHLYGQPAPVEALVPLARAAGAHVVGDAAQAHGARRHGRAIGSLGAIAGTSFYPSKNLGAYGDGGAVLTDDADLAKRVRALGNYGSETKHSHPEIGFNSRLDTLQAVVLRAKLRRLSAWNDERRAAARRYDEALAEVAGVTPVSTLEGSEHVHHLYVVRVARRDEVLAGLAAADIGAGIHYPTPIHLQGAFAHLGNTRGDFPVAEQAAAEILSLPIYPGITADDQARVVRVLRELVRR